MFLCTIYCYWSIFPWPKSESFFPRQTVQSLPTEVLPLRIVPKWWKWPCDNMAYEIWFLVPCYCVCYRFPGGTTLISEASKPTSEISYITTTTFISIPSCAAISLFPPFLSHNRTWPTISEFAFPLGSSYTELELLIPNLIKVFICPSGRK